MKASKVASVVAALLATDAKPTESQILAAIIAADKKGKDGSPLGEAGVEMKDKAKDKAKDAERDDPESTNDEDMDDKAKDEKEDKAEDKDCMDEDYVDGMDDIQPTKSATGNSGMGGKEPAKDKKGMDAAALVKQALDARDALHAARRDVEPVLGVVAYDSAADVYKAALDKLGVATDGVHASAFPALFKLARDRADAAAAPLASDAATVKGMAGVIRGYDRLR